LEFQSLKKETKKIVERLTARPEQQQTFNLLEEVELYQEDAVYILKPTVQNASAIGL